MRADYCSIEGTVFIEALPQYRLDIALLLSRKCCSHCCAVEAEMFV